MKLRYKYAIILALGACALTTVLNSAGINACRWQFYAAHFTVFAVVYFIKKE